LLINGRKIFHRKEAVIGLKITSKDAVLVVAFDSTRYDIATKKTNTDASACVFNGAVFVKFQERICQRQRKR